MSRHLTTSFIVTLGLLGANATQAATLVYDAYLVGTNEVPANPSFGTGIGIITLDNVAQTLQVDITFSGLTGTTTASHIHCCAPVGSNGGVATQVPTFIGFPTGVTSGSYFHIFDLTQASTYNPAFVTDHGGTVASAESDFLAGLASGQTYLNIHTSAFPGGEIRGQINLVPEPEAWALMIMGFGLVGATLRRRRGLAA
jgi:hypothetical protein